MATTISGSVTFNVKAKVSEPIDIGTRAFNVNQTYSEVFTDGTGANQVKKIWSDTRTISASSNDDLDLAGGVVDAFGTTLTFTAVKAIFVKAADGNTNNVVVGAEGTNEFASMFGDVSDTIVLPPGSFVAFSNPSAAGYAVTAGTGDKLRITNAAGGSDVTYDIVIMGEV